MKRKTFAIAIIGMVLSVSLSGCGILTMQEANAKAGIKALNDIGDRIEEYNDKKEKATPTAEPTEAPTPKPIENPTEGYDVQPGETKLIQTAGIFTYGNMQVEIPTEWINKVYVAGYDSGFNFMDAYSYGVDQSGFMFGFFESDNNVMSYAGEIMLAYTPEHVYYMQSPTDVPYLYDVPEAVEAYRQTTSYCSEVMNSLHVLEDGAKYDAGEFIFPMSCYKELDEYCTSDLSTNQIDLAIGEIYARYGVSFDDYFTKNYFDKFSWYEDKGISKDSVELNDAEKKNVARLQELSKDMQGTFAYPQKYDISETAKAVLNSKYGESTVQISFDGDYGEKTATIIVDGDTWTSDHFDVIFENPNEDEYFITKLDMYNDSCEIALVDFGNDDWSSTKYFKLDDKKNLRYLGQTQGIPFEGYSAAGYDFTNYGGVYSYERSEKLGGFRYAVYCWYDDEELRLINNNDDASIYPVIPGPLMEITKEFEVQNPDSYDTENLMLDKGMHVSIVSYNTGNNEVRLHVKETGKDVLLQLDSEVGADYSKYLKINN